MVNIYRKGIKLGVNRIEGKKKPGFDFLAIYIIRLSLCIFNFVHYIFT